MFTRNVTKVILLVMIDIIIIVGVYFLGLEYIARDNALVGWKLVSLFTIFVVVKLFVYFFTKLYHFLFDHVGAQEFMRIVFAATLSNFVIFFVLFLSKYAEIKWYFFLFTTPLEILLMTAVRFYRRIRRRIVNATILGAQNKFINTIIVGAGSAGRLALEEIEKNNHLHNKVVLFVDDDESKFHKQMCGVEIIGPVTSIPELIDKYDVKEVVIAIASLDKARLSDIIEIVSTKQVKIKRLPLMLEDQEDDKRKIIDVRIEDLLNRGVIQLDNHGLNELINGKTVLVTGGGGSIGSELTEQILNYNPKQLIIFDIYENTTYETQVSLSKRINNEKLTTELIVLIGSVYNDVRLESIFEKYAPEIIFHAAAYKHVPLMEDNAVEAVRTNILGTYNVASLANKYHVKKMILISSDKAVRPTNVMGATKAVCERIIQYFDAISETNYAAVRFGNVLGSHGSVVPLFKKQIEEGGPVTITHPDITRFFMTIPEAVSLILQSAVYAQGGEIFILDMGEPVKIVDLAYKMIRLSGLVPEQDIKIKFVGLRPGEKLYEELLLDVSKHIKTANDKIYIDKRQEISQIEEFMTKVREHLDCVDNEKMKQLVQSLIKAYKIDYNHNNNH
ncbi:MAG: polysaccharide biosynthesis protein [Bacilli bacterium]